MQIAICDDEKEIRKMLADKVRKYYPKANIVSCQSGEELLAAGRQADILFLDIQMPGKDGMETAREFRKKNRKTILIFVTAIEEYVFQAFDVGAFHYLVKPFTDEKFVSVLRKAVEQYYEMSDGAPGKSQKEEKYLMIKSEGTHIKVLLDDIIYAEVFNRKVVIHKEIEDIEYYGKLSDLEKQAGEAFFRTHRAYLVHFKYVVKYNASTIWLQKGTALLAKRHYPEFVQSYLKYNRRKGIGQQV